LADAGAQIDGEETLGRLYAEAAAANDHETLRLSNLQAASRNDLPDDARRGPPRPCNGPYAKNRLGVVATDADTDVMLNHGVAHLRLRS
jgi:hypothetical protein